MKDMIKISLKRKQLQLLEFILAKKSLIKQKFKHIKSNKNKIIIVCYGDSVTFGTGINKNKSYVKILSRKLSELNINNLDVGKIKMLNISKEGITTNYALNYLNKVLYYKPCIIIINFFLNDLDILEILDGKVITKTSQKKLINSIHNMINKINKRLPKTQIIFWGPTPLTRSFNIVNLNIKNKDKLLKQINTKHRKLIKYMKNMVKEFNKSKNKNKTHYCDFYEDVFYRKQSLIQSDGIHPNEKGHKVIADRLFECIKMLI